MEKYINKINFVRLTRRVRTLKKLNKRKAIQLLEHKRILNEISALVQDRVLICPETLNNIIGSKEN